MAIFNESCTCQDCLRKAPVFHYLSEDELALFDAHRYQMIYKPGELIIKQGTPITHLISYTNGLAKVYIEGLNGRNLILQFLTPNKMAGGPGLFVDNKWHYSIKAVEESSACFISLQVFQDVMKMNCEFNMNMLRMINSETIKNFGKFISLTQKQMPGRIAEALLHLTKEVYKSNPAKLTISRQDLADMTAMTKESAIRILKQFKDDNIISVDGDNLKINKEEELEKISLLG
jgi:CRP/FNR family transcriptional regulator, polysaccharide utilization system transcription regulator